ncbi:peptidoglycan-binding protein [Neofusicoccum parvum]|nr:peptidoglycan-binding protein [Neofusicoccum parvum]
MTASRDYGSRQDLLEALTLAVELVHPAAVRTIVDYVANPLTDDELSQFVQALHAAADCDDWPQNMTRQAQSRLLDRINHAKTRYATSLRARNQHDIQIKWSYEHSLQSLGMLHSKNLAAFFEGLWTRRYTQCARGNLGPQSYRSFSVVLSSSEYARLCEFVKDRRIDVSENVLQTFGPLETGSTPRTLQEIHLQMVGALHDIHNHRFEIATTTTERGNEPWFPFPNVVRQSNEVVAPIRIENMMGRKLDFINDWDSGKAGDVTRSKRSF